MDSVGNFIDGGADGYIRVGGRPLEEWENLCLYTDDPHEKIRKFFLWASYGKDGKQDKKYIALKDLTDEHLAAIIETQAHIRNTYVEVLMLAEVEYRKEHGIVVTEKE